MDFWAWKDDYIAKGREKWGTGVCWDYMDHGDCYGMCGRSHPVVRLRSDDGGGTVAVMPIAVRRWISILEAIGFVRDNGDEFVCKFGKHYGKRASEVPENYVSWCRSVETKCDMMVELIEAFDKHKNLEWRHATLRPEAATSQLLQRGLRINHLCGTEHVRRLEQEYHAMQELLELQDEGYEDAEGVEPSDVDHSCPPKWTDASERASSGDSCGANVDEDEYEGDLGVCNDDGGGGGSEGRSDDDVDDGGESQQGAGDNNDSSGDCGGGVEEEEEDFTTTEEKEVVDESPLAKRPRLSSSRRT